MNSLQSLIIKTPNNHKRTSFAMPSLSNSLINSLPIVKFSTSDHCSIFGEQVNWINQRKDVHHHQHRRSVVITNNTSSNFRSAILPNHHPQQQHMKRYQHHRGYISNHFSSLSKQKVMISLDHHHDQTIGLMQSRSTPVNHPFSSSTGIESNSSIDEQKKYISSGRIRLALRCSCPFDDKQQQQFDEIFSSNDQNTNITERILNECLARLTTNNTSNALIILSGQSREVQTAILATTVTRLYQFSNENLDQDLILRLNIQEFLHYKTPTCLLSSNDYFVSSPNETIDYLNNLCSNDHSNPLLITFLLQTRSSNTLYALLNILCPNETDNERTKEAFSHLLMSLSLSYSSNRQKQKKENNRTNNQALSSVLNEYLAKHFVYIFADVKSEKQLKYWTKIQRLLRMKRNRLKMSRDRYDGSSIETMINRHQDEIWIDGPYSSRQEIWIDGPREFYPYTKQSPSRAKPSILSPKPTILSSTLIPKDSSSNKNNFDTESMISSHCHLPVLPVFKDHSLLPFRSNETLPRTKPSINESTKIDLKLSTNQLNDDMELLEKTLETLLIPSPIVPIANEKDPDTNQSVHRIDQLSSLMSIDEKSKRLSRIVSPTRFEKILMDSQSSTWLRSPSTGSSVPNSPALQTKVHHPRMLNTSISMTPQRTLISSIKPKILSESNRQTSVTRPSLFQRLFGLRSSSTPQRRAQPVPLLIESSTSSPLISPLTVTLDSRDDLMPLTTSSTTSSASGRASSSGYESMSNTVLEEMIAAIPAMINSENKLRNKSTRKSVDERESNTNIVWYSPNLREKSHRQQRLVQLKHRQNELKLELAMTKNFLLMDKNKNNDQNESAPSTIGHSSMHQNLSNPADEDELEKEIDHLERRLAIAKSQLMLVTSQKGKPLKC